MSHHNLSFNGVCYQYPHGKEALVDVTFRMEHGEKLGIIGLNGSGKSTLLRHINGLLLPGSGSVTVGDIPVTKKTLKLVRTVVGMVFQYTEDMLFSTTLYEDVAFGLHCMLLPEEEVERRTEYWLRKVGLWEERHQNASTLSVGRSKSAAIATVLAMNPAILVLDEPTAGLDSKARKQVLQMVQDYQHSTIVASHDFEFLSEVTERILVLENGRLIRDEKTKDLFENKTFLREHELL